MSRYFLAKVGKKTVIESLEKKDKRHKVWAMERDFYGFDATEIWNLDDTLLMMIYERLELFLQQASGIVDLSYSIEVESEERGLDEWIREILTLIHRIWTFESISEDKDPDYTEEQSRKDEEKVYTILSRISRHLWW